MLARTVLDIFSKQNIDYFFPVEHTVVFSIDL